MRGLLVLWMGCLMACPASAQATKTPSRSVGGETPPNPRAGASASERQLERRFRARPELVLETGGRTGVCDVLTFTPDGKHLLAAGEDKVVRVWKVTEQGLEPDRVLRWPVFREFRGQIYALALDSRGRQVAVGGDGVCKCEGVVVC